MSHTPGHKCEAVALLQAYVEAYKDHPERLGSGSSVAHQTFLLARALLAKKCEVSNDPNPDRKGGN